MQAAVVSKISSEQFGYLKQSYPAIGWIDVSADREKLASLGPDLAIVYGNVRPFEFEKLPGLKWIHATWTGVENLMRLPLTERGVIVTNTHGHVSSAIAEHVVGSVYYLARHMGRFHNASMNGEWCTRLSAQYVKGSHVLVLGLGSLGFEICTRLKANGVRVSGVNSRGTPVEFCDNVYSPECCRDILKTVDHVICCLPSVPATDNTVDAGFLDACKDGVTIINVGRGNAVNQDDLLAAVNSGRVKGAVLDTTTPEPLNGDSPLYRHPDILITAHRSWMPSNFGSVSFDTFMRNIGPFLDGRYDDMPERVDTEKGY